MFFRTFFHRLISPKWFYQLTSKIVPWVGGIALLLLTMGLVWGLLFTPPDYLQGHSYRIIFIHVPAASLALSLYAIMALNGAIGFIWRIKLAHLAAKSLAPIGASFCLLALMSGSFWGKPTWGTWWIWDARLTSMLILFFLYLGPIALQQSIAQQETADRACALLVITGLINLPIIKYSVEWWNTLHQGASISIQSTSISPVMLYPLLCSLAGFYVFALFAFLLRVHTEIIKNEHKSRWLKEKIGGLPNT